MEQEVHSESMVIFEGVREKGGLACRKTLGINRGIRGSVRNLNGMIYLDFHYIGIRVREPYGGLRWDGDRGLNVMRARSDLNVINEGIAKQTFIFSEVFPNSKRARKIASLEVELGVRKIRPEDLLIKDHIETWMSDLRKSGTQGITLVGYARNNTNYILPYWGQKSFAHLKKGALPGFYEWVRDRELRGEPVSNNSINVYTRQLIRIAKHAAEANEWGGYVAFLGYQPLQETDPYEQINPFSQSEQELIFKHLPHVWRPYVEFAFASGLSVSELNGIKLDRVHIDPAPGKVRIDAAWTLDEEGRALLGRTKNKYRRRTLQMNPRMRKAVEVQLEVRKRERIEGEFFFCKPDGTPICDSSWFITNVWRPTLKKAVVDYRSFRETRHSFATEHLSKGGDPLEVAAAMGHRDAQMVLKCYAKFKRKAEGVAVGMSERVQCDYEQ
jgi:integrase